MCFWICRYEGVADGFGSFQFSIRMIHAHFICFIGFISLLNLFRVCYIVANLRMEAENDMGNEIVKSKLRDVGG